jgi:pyruvate/2-oxoglutarate/acetoin dehydrogenase E1 component
MYQEIDYYTLPIGAALIKEGKEVTIIAFSSKLGLEYLIK